MEDSNMITPLDIENKKFSKQMMNGYNVEDVDDFLDELVVDYLKIPEIFAGYFKYYPLWPRSRRMRKIIKN